MKIRKWKKRKNKQQAYFRMIQDGICIQIILCDPDGNPIKKGNILTIAPAGIRLYRSINPDLGLPLDEDGKFKILP